MPPDPTPTQCLAELSAGDADAANRLIPLIYNELHALAAACFASENPGHTLQPTAVVNEAYPRLIDQTRVRWQGRAHFFAVASVVIRRVLVDHARARASDKRGGGMARVDPHRSSRGGRPNRCGPL